MTASRSLIRPFKQIADGAMSGDITGLTTNVEFIDSAVVYIEWSGTAPVGVFSAEFLKTPAGNVNDEVWETIDFGQTIAISGNTGSHTLQFSEMPFTKIRPKYVRTSGVGALNVVIMAKGL
jgi:hypothetical protein